MDSRLPFKSRTVVMTSTVILLLLQLNNFTYVQGKCPSQKASRKKQEAILNALQPNHVIAETTYMGELEGIYRFQVEQVWENNNGGLKRFTDISVHANTPQLNDCFHQLKINDNFILMMIKSDEGHNEYTAVAPPVASKRRKHRQSVWLRLCSDGSDGSTCSMRITLPSSTVFYRGSNKLLLCNVESSSAIVEVKWFKDGSNIDTTIHKMAGLFVETRDKENSFVMITGANHVHDGKYSCVAENAEGQTATGTTKVTVIGPRSESHFKPCKDPQYCMNGGRCKQFVVETTKPICECHVGFRGDRCQEVIDDITASSTKDEKNTNLISDELSRLTTAVVVVTIALLCVILFSFLYVARIRRQLSPDKDAYNVVNQCCSDSDQSKSDIEAARSTSNGTEGTSVPLSVVDAVDRSEFPNSRATSPRKTSNAQFFATTSEHLTPRQSFKGSSNDFEAKLSINDSISRNGSTASDRSPRRGRLSAKSLN